MEAKVGGDEELRSMFVQWVDYQAQMEHLAETDPMNEERIIGLQDSIDKLWESMSGRDGFSALWDSYTAWRQEQGRSSSPWELPADWWKSAGSNEIGVTSQDLANFNNVPQEIGKQIRSGMSGIKVVLDGETVGRLVAPSVSGYIASQVTMMPY